jgi:hypothetical protein
MKPTRSHRRAIPPLLVTIALSVLALCLAVSSAGAFCGFYVASSDERITNRASKVILARDGDRTVLTMASDFQGDPKQFAVVIPVPTVLQKGQVHIGDSTAVDHIALYSVPRLVEYTDPNPCPRSAAMRYKGVAVRGDKKMAALGGGALYLRDVVVEAQYRVDEYDIVILSSTDSRALGRWLRDNGYKVPPKAESVLASYIKQGMFFFVAKVDLKEQQRLGYSYLRPIQVAFESPKFMLPIRLGMVNADGPQEMLVFTLTRRGRVESTNYRTIRVPTDVDVPEFVKEEFTSFYPLLLAKLRRSQGDDVIVQEYAWVVSPERPTCDPCTAPHLSAEVLRELGAYWIYADGRPSDAVLTRLHIRYDVAHFPEDLQFHETGDRVNWQARYVIHHPYRGADECSEMKGYVRSVWKRREAEATNYASLTGSDKESVRRRMGARVDWSQGDEAVSWWERLWRR